MKYNHGEEAATNLGTFELINFKEVLKGAFCSILVSGFVSQFLFLLVFPTFQVWSLVSNGFQFVSCQTYAFCQPFCYLLRLFEGVKFVFVTHSMTCLCYSTIIFMSSLSSLHTSAVSYCNQYGRPTIIHDSSPIKLEYHKEAGRIAQVDFFPLISKECIEKA